MKTIIFLVAFTAMIASGNNANTQIIYKDIIPDTTLYVPNVYADSTVRLPILLNNDTVIDFWVGASRINIGTVTGKMTFINDIVHNNKAHGGCLGGGSDSEYYSFNDTINSNASWWSVQQEFLYVQSGLPWSCYPPTGDLYVGLQLNVNDTLYYGWLRISAQNTSVTIKDMAYNTVSNEYILAGQTATSSADITFAGKYRVYGDTGKIILTITNNDILPVVIGINTQMGQLIYNAQINHFNLLIPNLLPGLYFITITSGNSSKTQQVLVY